MKKVISKKATLMSLAMFFAAGTSYAATCSINCDSYARTERNKYCAQVGGGSACDSSPGLYNHFYEQCRRNYCTN